MQASNQKKLMQEFVSQFTSENVFADVADVSKSFFEIPPFLKQVTDKIHHPFFSAGEFLGKIEKGKFIPSVSILKRISKVTDRIAIINDESAWLFVCGRNILSQSIVECRFKEGPVMVSNTRGEILGYGTCDNGQIMHQFDLGDFLRRER